jgi:hypothetical protein
MSAEGKSKTILENGWFINNTVDESGNTGHCTYQREMQIDKKRNKQMDNMPRKY